MVPIMKRKEITIWVRVCPNWEKKFNSKKGWKEKLFLWNQRSKIIYPNKKNEFMVLNNKKMEIIIWISVCPNDKWTLTLKNDGKRSFSFETKASMSFIPTRRLRLWCLIMKRKEITMWIRVYPNWVKKLSSKKWWKEKLFLRS